MKCATLVIMAAGIGSRFGGGIKQLEPVGPNGEIIMDYSIHDAIEAGFNKIVFVIRREIEEEFRRIIGDRIGQIAEIAYVYQEVDDIPEEYKEKYKNRTKPWGTGQAILCCRKVVKESFVVINADDYYGKEAFVKVHDYLVKEQPRQEETLSICMAGFILGNTLSDNGSVTRGVCQVDKDSHLVKVTETHNIVKTEDGAGVLQEDGSILPLDADSYVVYACYDVKFVGFDTLVPGLTPFYVSRNEEGRYYIRDWEHNPNEAAYANEVTAQEDVAALYDRIRNESAEILAGDEELSQYLSNYLNDMMVAVGEALNEKENSPESTEAPTESAAAQESESKSEPEASQPAQTPSQPGIHIC